jgi:hypothetical protein
LPRPLGLLRQDGLGGFTPSGSLVQGPGPRSLATLRLHVGGQLLRLTEETAAASVLRSLALVICHRPRLRDSGVHVQIRLRSEALFDGCV